jgi:hypothetical protein
VSFQRLKTWKQSRDPDFEAKKNRILHLYGLMDGTNDVEPGDPEVVICIDEFGPLNLQPHPGRQWTTRAGGGPRPRRRRRATYTRPHGVRHLLAAYDLSRDRPDSPVNRHFTTGPVAGFLVDDVAGGPPSCGPLVWRSASCSPTTKQWCEPAPNDPGGRGRP